MGINTQISQIPQTKDCYIGDQKVDCPKQDQARTESQTNLGSTSLDLLPNIPSLEVRNDLVFGSIFILVVFGFLLTAILKIKIFGMTIVEYLKPIWHFVLIALAVVFWQYLVGVNLEASMIQLQISQVVWALAVAASAYKLSKILQFSYRNVFFLGVLYSFIIHGLKVSIRYFFYDKTLLYVLDRFLYGSLLVMAITVIAGTVFVYLKGTKKKI